MLLGGTAPLFAPQIQFFKHLHVGWNKYSGCAKLPNQS